MQVSITSNPDVVRTHVNYTDLVLHDFWGNDLFNRRGTGWTHYSWRPLVTLTFRADWQLGGEHRLIVLHSMNVVYYVMSALCAYAAFRVLLRAVAPVLHPLLARDAAAARASLHLEYGQARAAALLFALHPIHTECVANCTGRADVMASIFQFASLFVYIGTMAHVRWESAQQQDRGSCRGCARTIGTPWALSCCCAMQEIARQGACTLLFCFALVCKETTLTLPMLCATADIALGLVQAAIHVSELYGDAREQTSQPTAVKAGNVSECTMENATRSEPGRGCRAVHARPANEDEHTQTQKDAQGTPDK
ncbi:hypothetical protein EON67_06470, partial [archaeon]